MSIPDWLLSTGSPSEPEPLLLSLVEKLAESGIVLTRIRATLLTTHAELYGRNVTWQKGKGVETVLTPLDIKFNRAYIGSPVQLIHEGADRYREKLGSEPAKFSGVEDLRQVGATDYLIVALPFRNLKRSYVSMATDAPGGWTEEQLAVLEGMVPALSLRLELASSYLATESLLQMYLGQSAAAQVIGGDFERGKGQQIEAAVWFCDLRGFTTLTETRPMKDVLALLDRYFDVTCAAIATAGGEVLKFIGDAVLGIFPVKGDRAETARTALSAARAALASIDAYNATRGDAPELKVGIGLHIGQVVFGNIGSKARLDFTVIGPAVNEAARIESLCKPLGQRLLVSEKLQSALGETLPSLGKQALKGVGEAIEVFAGEQ